jgi:hypothetical protein
MHLLFEVCWFAFGLSTIEDYDNSVPEVPTKAMLIV